VQRSRTYGGAGEQSRVLAHGWPIFLILALGAAVGQLAGSKVAPPLEELEELRSGAATEFCPR
jgi:hypothetical protein